MLGLLDAVSRTLFLQLKSPVPAEQWDFNNNGCAPNSFEHINFDFIFFHFGRTGNKQANHVNSSLNYATLITLHYFLKQSFIVWKQHSPNNSMPIVPNGEKNMSEVFVCD